MHISKCAWLHLYNTHMSWAETSCDTNKVWKLTTIFPLLYDSAIFTANKALCGIWYVVFIIFHSWLRFVLFTITISFYINKIMDSLSQYIIYMHGFNGWNISLKQRNVFRHGQSDWAHIWYTGGSSVLITDDCSVRVRCVHPRWIMSVTETSIVVRVCNMRRGFKHQRPM